MALPLVNMIIISLFFRQITKNKGQWKNTRPAGVARTGEGAKKEKRQPKDQMIHGDQEKQEKSRRKKIQKEAASP